MEFLKELNRNSNDQKELEIYLKKNIDIVYDFFLSQSFLEISEYRDEIERYIHSKFGLIKNLDLNNKTNSAFSLILLEVSERFGFQLYFKQLFRLLNSSNVHISQRLKAADMYSSGMRQLSNFETVLGEMLCRLEDAYQNEEDDIDGILSIIVNFYAHIVQNFGEFNSKGVNQIKYQFIERKDEFFILQNDLIGRILKIDPSNSHLAYNEIHKLLDEYLKRTKFIYPFQNDSFLIETNTSYSEDILNMEYTLDNILRKNKILYSRIKDDNYYRALGRGVNILDKEEYMLAYMYAYGKMHIAKLNIALSKLPPNLYNIEVIDWGCGQGLAAMVLLDSYSPQNINSITLVEPSILCLKRAALHVNQKYSILNTINKDFDSLNIEDFNIINDEGPFFHLFSNILDVEKFSLHKLITLIKTKFKGTNYFLIASPYITFLRIARIDSFIDAFDEQFDTKILYSSEKRSGEWLNTWSKVIRVIQVEIE